MEKACSLMLVFISFFVPFRDNTVFADAALEYPCYLVDAYDADGSCWMGMDKEGRYGGTILVAPERWLVGPPLSEKSGVTLPPDHWVEVQFRGPLIDGPGDDIKLIELGPVREQALVFITDITGREYLLGKALSGDVGGGVDPTLISFDIAGIDWPFEPRAIRILGLDTGGQAPGFDIASVRARVAGDCGGDTACNPVPVNGAKNVNVDATVSWSPGKSAQKHLVHFSSDITEVDVNAASAVNMSLLQDSNSFDPCDLELGKTYYWRIDEVNDTDVRPGEVWSFTTTDNLVFDDFEQYDFLDPSHSDSNRLNDTWKNADVYLWTENSHGCSKKSMGFYYWYYQTTKYTEAVRTLSPAQDWTASGIVSLELFFSGLPYNDAAQMYIALNDGSSEIVIPYAGDANDLKNELWQPWRIDLEEVTSIDLSHVTSISIGFCSEVSKPSSSGGGTVYIDDIKLYATRCIEEDRLATDLNCDCLVNYPDFEEMAGSWLANGRNTYPAAAPKQPVAWYKFDGNTRDSAGSADGEIRGNPTYAQGIYGQAMRFDGDKDSIELTGVANLFARTREAITIAFWQYGDESPHHTDTICCSNYTYGLESPVVSINLGCWRRPGRYNWDCGRPWSFESRLSGNHRYSSEWSGRWNHWAFTKDSRTGEMQIFLNGQLYDRRTGIKSPITGINSFQIGSGWYGGYDGLIDDFRIYDYALTGPEIVHIATDGTGVFDLPLLLPADFNNDNRIDFADFAVLADNWLETWLWP